MSVPNPRESNDMTTGQTPTPSRPALYRYRKTYPERHYLALRYDGQNH